MDLLKELYNLLMEMEAVDPVILDMTQTPIPTDYFAIMTANSSVHMKSLRERILDFLKRKGINIIYYDKGEGYDWLIIDGGDIVVHIFTEKGRDFYDLEGLWVDAERIRFDKR